MGGATVMPLSHRLPSDACSGVDVRNTISSVLNASIVIGGFVAVEALFNLINRDVLGCLVALAMLAIIPTCGWYGALGKKRSMLRAFYVSNAACALCYLGGVVVVAAVVIPSWRCVCDPSCTTMGDTAPPPDALIVNPLGDEQHMQFHGADMDDRAEQPAMVGVPADAMLREELGDMCSSISFAGRYASAALSLAAAAVHLYGFVLGRRLHHAIPSSVEVAAAAAAAATAKASSMSGPVSAPGVLLHHVAPTAYMSGPRTSGAGRRSTALFMRTSGGDVEAQGGGGVDRGSVSAFTDSPLPAHVTFGSDGVEC